jgi:hypothetical protein
VDLPQHRVHRPLAWPRAQVDVLRAIKEFKRGIYLLQWENRHKEMEVRLTRPSNCLLDLLPAFPAHAVRAHQARMRSRIRLTNDKWPQAEDVAALTRELQLLHVTKEFQQLIKGGAAAAAGASTSVRRHAEAASLEGLLRSREQLHARRLAGYKRSLQRLQQEVELKQAQSNQVDGWLYLLSCCCLSQLLQGGCCLLVLWDLLVLASQRVWQQRRRAATRQHVCSSSLECHVRPVGGVSTLRRSTNQLAHPCPCTQVGVHVEELAASMGEHSKLQPAGGGAAAARQVFRGLMRNRELRDIAAQQVGAVLPLRQAVLAALPPAASICSICLEPRRACQPAARSPRPAANLLPRRRRSSWRRCARRWRA